MTIAIIGAGMAGLACARRLIARGHSVTVFDKGRGPGGRMSTRRAQTPRGEIRFDHGAQYFTAADPEFLTLVKALSRDGHVAPWTGRVVEIGRDGVVHPAEDKPRFVGTPAMNSVIRALANDIDVRFGARVTALNSGANGGWTLERFGKEAEATTCDTLIMAAPAEQAGELLSPVHEAFAVAARGIDSLPNWTAMLAFESPIEVDWDGARLTSGAIGWAARNGSKPGREGETWVVQSTAEWAREHLEETPESAGEKLLAAFRRLTGTCLAPTYVGAHRWRFAFPRVPDPDGQTRFHQDGQAGFLFDPVSRLGVCGDWCLGPRVEAAWLSGDRLGAAIG
jgi:renalase